MCVYIYIYRQREMEVRPWTPPDIPVRHLFPDNVAPPDLGDAAITAGETPIHLPRPQGQPLPVRRRNTSPPARPVRARSGIEAHGPPTGRGTQPSHTARKPTETTMGKHQCAPTSRRTTAEQLTNEPVREVPYEPRIHVANETEATQNEGYRPTNAAIPFCFRSRARSAQW